MNINRYNYKKLLAAATASDARQADIDALGAWFEQYGETFWNGEYYDADGERLFPIFVPDGDDFKVVGYKFR